MLKSHKYPRTMHFSWSPGLQNDDRVIESLDAFIGREVVVTEKLDGENTTMLAEGLHARSLDSRNHPSRNWVKQLHGSIAHLIPTGYRVCGENVFAEHSIGYKELESYFYGFSVWDDRNVALDWDLTLAYFEDLNILPVPTLYRGVFDEKLIKDLAEGLNKETQEGLVCRVTGEIPYDDFDKLVAKFVRKGHVQTDAHWMTKAVVPNKLKA